MTSFSKSDICVTLKPMVVDPEETVHVVNEKWIFDSLAAFKTQPFEEYDMSCQKEKEEEEGSQNRKKKKTSQSPVKPAKAAPAKGRKKAKKGDAEDDEDAMED